MEEMKGWTEARRKTTSPAAYTVQKLQKSSERTRRMFASNTLRFGTSGAGLTTEQVASITAPNLTVKMTSDGYIRLLPKGTLIGIQ